MEIQKIANNHENLGVYPQGVPPSKHSSVTWIVESGSDVAPFHSFIFYGHFEPMTSFCHLPCDSMANQYFPQYQIQWHFPFHCFKSTFAWRFFFWSNSLPSSMLNYSLNKFMTGNWSVIFPFNSGILMALISPHWVMKWWPAAATEWVKPSVDWFEINKRAIYSLIK
jgi:hypothetical protein